MQTIISVFSVIQITGKRGTLAAISVKLNKSVVSLDPPELALSGTVEGYALIRGNPAALRFAIKGRCGETW